MDWIIFIPACFTLNRAFGPNNLLAMNHGAKSGVSFAQRAAVGRLLVLVPMIAASALGLGVKLWRSAGTVASNTVEGETTSLGNAFKAEASVAISNPKAILIFAGFFPQFVALDAYWTSYAMLGAAFLIMEALAIFFYASLGKFASRFATGKLALMQRASGLTMCLFGALLLVSPQPSRS